MSKQTFDIDNSNIEAVKDYIRHQFTQLSWWPAEQPWKAKEEFESLDDNPKALASWCEKWLDGGQWSKLKKAIKD